MRSIAVTLLFAAVIAFAVVRADEEVATPVETEEAPAVEKGIPLLVVSKTVSNKMVLKGGAIDVTVTVINFGSAAAYNVKLSDDVTDGETKTKEVDVLDSLENITLTYSVTPANYGAFAVPVATVTYSIDAAGASQLTALSNEVLEEEFVFQGETVDDMAGRGTVQVATSDEYERANTKYIKESIAYLVLAGVLVLFPFYTYRTKQDQVDYLIRNSRKK